MADLTLRIRGDVDAKDLVGLSGTAEELAQQLRELEAAADDLSGKKIGINIDTTVKGSGEIKKVVDLTDDLDKETLKLETSLKKATAAEKGSVSSSRALVATLNQQRNAVKTGSYEWNFLAQRLEAANAKYREAQGIQRGSAADISAQIGRLKQLQSQTNQTASATSNWNQAISGLNSQLRRQQGIQQGSLTDLQAYRAELIKSRDATNKFTDPKGFAELAKSIAGVDSKLSALESPFKKLARFVDTIGRIRVAIDAVSDAFTTVNATINTFVSRAKQVESFNLALQNIGYSAQESNKAFQQATQTALDLGAPLAGVEKSYRRMIPSLKAIGVSSADSDKFIEQLSARTQVLGLNTEQSGRLIEAFAQVLSKGKLSAEELNQQISELDGAFRTQLATALNVSTQELTEMVAAGSVGSTEFVKAFLRMDNGVDILRQRLESGNGTIQQFQNQIATLNTKNVEAVADAFDPLFRSILRTQLAFTKLFSVIAGSSGFKALGQLSGDVVQSFGTLTLIVVELLGALVKVLEPIAALANELVRAEVFGVRLGHILGVLLAIFVQNAVAGLFAKGVAAIGAAANNSAGPVGKLATKLGGLNGIFGTIKTQGLVKGLLNIGRQSLSITGGQLLSYFGRLGGVLLKVGGVALKIGAAILTLKGLLIGIGVALAAGLIKQFFDYKKGVEAAKPAVDAATEANKKLRQEVLGLPEEKVKGFFEKLLEGARNSSPALRDVENITKGITGFFKQRAFEDQFNGFADGVQKADAEISKMEASLNKLGGGLAKNSDLTRVNVDTLQTQRQGMGLVIEAMEAGIKAREAFIQKLKEEFPEQVGTIAALEGEAQASRAVKAQKEEIIKNIDKEIERRILNGEAIGTEAQRLAVLSKAVTDATKSQTLLTAQAEASSYTKLVNGILSAEQAEAQRLSAKAIGSANLLVAQKGELALLEKIKNSETGLRDDQKARYEELQVAAAKTESETAQAFKAVEDSIVNSFEQGINEANELVAIAVAAASRITSAFSSISGAASSGIQAGLQVVSTLSSAIQGDIQRETDQRIASVNASEKERLRLLEASGVRGEALERQRGEISKRAARDRANIENESSDAQRQVLLKELETKSRMADVEYEIENIRLEVAARVRIAEAQAMQARLKGEAAIAKARGEDQAAEELTRAAALQDTVIRGAQIEFELQKGIAGFRRDQQNAAIAATAAQNNIDGFQVRGLDTAINKVNSFAAGARNATRELAGASKKAIDVGANLSSKNIENGQKKAEEVGEAIKKAAENGASFGESMAIVAQSFQNSVSSAGQLLVVLRSIGRVTGMETRATGGPVAAGSQYLVNDGGGREAFLNSFGRMSMLPPGKNIKWTAPSSGTVIPAHLVDDFRTRLMAREQINNSSSYQQPQTPVSRNIIKSTSNKTLTSSSSSQRIVNHVTIQSQSPLADASRLMANVSKIKSRRRV